MNAALAVEAITTASVIAGVAAVVVRGNSGLERARLAHNQHAADLKAAAKHTRTGSSTAGGRPRRAVPAGPASRVLPPAVPARSLPSGQAAGQAGRVPPVDTPVRLDDGRTGTVSTTVRVPGATRVHLDLDDGGRGHVDVPDTLPAPTPLPQPQPQPVKVPPAPPATPAAEAITRPVAAVRPRRVFVVPAPPALSAQSPAQAVSGTGVGMVRVGGFTMPASLTSTTGAGVVGSGRS